MDVPLRLATLLEKVLSTVHENGLDVFLAVLVVHLLHNEMVEDHLLLPGLHDPLFRRALDHELENQAGFGLTVTVGTSNGLEYRLVNSGE